MSNFGFLTIKERAELPPDEFGDPERKLFPLLTQEDINLAPQRISIFPESQSLKERLIDIAKRKGFTIPEVWADSEEVEQPSMSDFSDGVAEFELDETTKTPTKDGEWVLRTGKIFEAGSYPDKKFDISPEELCEAIADFKPVNLDLEHMPTILDGKLGRLEAVALGADGWSLIGTVRLPKWLDEQLGAAERKVSASWDRATKRLNKLALVRNPRVKDAAVMAAFMAHEFSDSLEGVTEADMAQTIETLLEEKFGEKTWAGKDLLQNIHDMTSRGGAVCIENEKKFNEAKEAGFVSASESKSIQQIHDAALRGGAKCNFIKERSGDSPSYYNTEEKKPMTMEDVKNFFKSMDNDDSKETTTSSEDTKAAELSAREEAVKAAEKTLAEKIAAFEASHAAKEEEVAGEDVDKDADYSENTPSERELQLEAELEELRNKEVARDAEQFADTEIKEGRAFPAEREALVAIYTQAAFDDKANDAKIVFNAGGKEVENNRVEALKQLYSTRTPHGLSFEQISDISTNLLATYSEDEDYIGDAEKQAKEYAARRNKLAQK